MNFAKTLYLFVFDAILFLIFSQHCIALTTSGTSEKWWDIMGIKMTESKPKQSIDKTPVVICPGFGNDSIDYEVQYHQ